MAMKGLQTERKINEGCRPPRRKLKCGACVRACMCVRAVRACVRACVRVCVCVCLCV